MKIGQKKGKKERETKVDTEMHRGKRTTGRGSSLVGQRLLEEYYYFLFSQAAQDQMIMLITLMMAMMMMMMMMMVVVTIKLIL